MFPWSSGTSTLHSFAGLPSLSSAGSSFSSGSYHRPALDAAATTPAAALPLTPASAHQPSRQHSDNGVDPSPASNNSACQSPNNNFHQAAGAGATSAAVQSSWLSPAAAAAAACGPQWPTQPTSCAAGAAPFPALPWQLPSSSSVPSSWPNSEPQKPLLDTKSYAQLMSSFWNAQSPHYAAAPPQVSASDSAPGGAGGLFSPFLEAGSPGGAQKRSFPSSSQQLAMASFLFSNSLNNFAAAQGNSWTPSASNGSIAHSPANKTLSADGFPVPQLRSFAGSSAGAAAGVGGGIGGSSACGDLKPFASGGSLFNGLSAPFMSGFMGAGSPFGVGLPALNDALNVPLPGAGVGAVNGAGGKRFASRTNGCECPNCQEADRLGPVVGAQLRKSGVHSCHIPGCGKVYNKVNARPVLYIV